MHGSRAPLLTLASDEVADEPTPTWFEPTSGRGRSALDEPFVEHEGELDLRLAPRTPSRTSAKGGNWAGHLRVSYCQNGNQAHECPISGASLGTRTTAMGAPQSAPQLRERLLLRIGTQKPVIGHGR
jgi:hypothetical protein